MVGSTLIKLRSALAKHHSVRIDERLNLTFDLFSALVWRSPVAIARIASNSDMQGRHLGFVLAKQVNLHHKVRHRFR